MENVRGKDAGGFEGGEKKLEGLETSNGSDSSSTDT